MTVRPYAPLLKTFWQETARKTCANGGEFRALLCLWLYRGGGGPPFYCQITPPLAIAAGIIWLGKEQTARKPTGKPVAAQVPHHQARPGVLRHAKHSRQRCGCIEFSASASHIAVFCPGKLGKLDISIFSVCCCCPVWFCNSGQTGHAVGGMNRSNQGICITPAAKHIAPFAPKARQIMRRLARVAARIPRQQQTFFQ